MRREAPVGVFVLVTAIVVGCATGAGSDGQTSDVDITTPSPPEAGVSHPAPVPEAGPTSPLCAPSACAARANATMACDADGNCVIGACVGQHADCNHDLTDGCEADIGSDVSNCAACGKSCPSPANGSASCALGTCVPSCWGGFSMLGAQCASFGGAYAVSDPGCASCATANVIGGACGCPAGFGAQTTMRLINDCSGSLHGALMTFCTAPGVAGSADWAGAYELDDAVAGSLGCRAPNLYTGACTCPSGATPIALRTIVDNSSTGALLGANLTICLNAAAPTTTFGGAYQKDDAVPGGVGCRATNPKTGACSCPAGTTARDYRTVADVPNGKIGTLISLCVP